MHPGSWSIGRFRLPDFGITEAVGDVLGRTRTYQGGSNLLGPQPQAQTISAQPQVLGQAPPSSIPTTTPKTPYTPTGRTGDGGTGGGGTGDGGTGGGEDPQERIRREVEAIYAPLINYLNQAESAVTSEYQRYVPELEQQYATSLSNIENQKTQGERELAAQEQAAGVRREDALSAARRLYEELRRGGRQRFGGASSAGQAFTELTAQEQQRQSGNIWQAYQQTLDNLNKYRANLLDNFAQAQKELELAKNSALQQAYTNYQNRRNEIIAKKGEAEGLKARALYDELQNLRNRVYQINLQSLNLAQTLAANRQMALSTVDQYSQRVAQSILGGSTSYQNLVNATTTNPTSNMSIGGRQASTVAPQTGVIAYKKPEDYLLGL